MAGARSPDLARCTVRGVSCGVGGTTPTYPTSPVDRDVGRGRGAGRPASVTHASQRIWPLRISFLSPVGGVAAGLPGELPGGAGPCLVGLPEYTGYRRIRSRLRPCSALAGCFTIIRVLRSSSAISVSALRSQACQVGVACSLPVASKILTDALRGRTRLSHASRMDHLYALFCSFRLPFSLPYPPTPHLSFHFFLPLNFD